MDETKHDIHNLYAKVATLDWIIDQIRTDNSGLKVPTKEQIEKEFMKNYGSDQ